MVRGRHGMPGLEIIQGLVASAWHAGRRMAPGSLVILQLKIILIASNGGIAAKILSLFGSLHFRSLATDLHLISSASSSPLSSGFLSITGAEGTPNPSMPDLLLLPGATTKESD